MSRYLCAFLLGLALACNKAEEKAAPEAVGAPAATPPPAEPAPAPPADTAEIPTEEEYEAEAERRITSDNLEAELDKLEKEIADQ